jgi:hypothetical protein
MRKYIILFFSVSVILFSCKKNKLPAGILDQDRMTNLLVQIHLTDGRLYAVPQNPDSLYKYGMGRYMNVFKVYGTDSAQFRKSYQYYARQSSTMVDIYDKVLKDLDQKKDSVNKAQYNRHGIPAK